MSWSSKTANNGKSKQIQEPDCTIDRSARDGVETCASDAVLEKSNSANKQKETLKVKHVNNNPNPTNKTWSPNVASSVPKISPSKSPESLNVARKVYC